MGGSGTVTRRPLVLMMQQCASDEYAEFSHLPGQRFTADAQICAAIEKATLDVCGPKGFSSDPIHLRYYAPTVPDLTLVDLPGVIKAHAADMDPRDPATIRRMVLEFATRPNSILLPVTRERSARGAEQRAGVESDGRRKGVGAACFESRVNAALVSAADCRDDDRMQVVSGTMWCG